MMTDEWLREIAQRMVATPAERFASVLTAETAREFGAWILAKLDADRWFRVQERVPANGPALLAFGSSVLGTGAYLDGRWYVNGVQVPSTTVTHWRRPVEGPRE